MAIPYKERKNVVQIVIPPVVEGTLIVEMDEEEYDFILENTS